MAITGLLGCSDPTFTGMTQLPTHKPAVKGHTTETPENGYKIQQVPVEPQKVRQFGGAPDRDLFRMAEELLPARVNFPRSLEEKPLEYSVGHSETFWLVDLANIKTYQSDFTLALITPHAYWYVEEILDFRIAELEKSAKHFEEDIYPTITNIFGTEWIPGIDRDPRLNILNAQLTNVAGYFSSSDEYPIDIIPRSNQREIIYVNAKDVLPGSKNYDLVLAHELQHIIHWNADPSEDTWINEGLSELATSLSLGSARSIRQFLRGDPVSLVHWPVSSADTIAHYGAASLFMHFFTEHYSNQGNLRGLLAQQKDGIDGIDQYLKENGYKENFKDVFKQWAAANILDEHPQAGDNILRYDGLKIRGAASKNIVGLKNLKSEIPQYSVEYTELKSISEPFQMSFQGNKNVELLPVEAGPTGCWWSNSGDSIDSTLSYHMEIPVGSTLALRYEVWFDIEENWDYLYIEISVDKGQHWRIIETPKTSPESLLGTSFGTGYTGKSDGWLTDSVDLTPFAGEEIWIRFQYVTDDAVNAIGACFRNLLILPTGITGNNYGWKSQGFVFTDNIVPQYFQVQLITVGDQPRVRQLFLDSRNSGTLTVPAPSDGERLILAVASLAEKTRESARYTVSLTPQK